MKQLVLLASFLMGMTLLRAQSPATTSTLDNSPLDMSYYPVDYPVLKIQNKISEPLIARVVYSRPQKRGRKLFGDLVTYGEVWRLGANEATEIEFFRDVKVDNKVIKKGRYTLYALVNQDKWTLILDGNGYLGRFPIRFRQGYSTRHRAGGKTGQHYRGVFHCLSKSTKGRRSRHHLG